MFIGLQGNSVHIKTQLDLKKFIEGDTSKLVPRPLQPMLRPKSEKLHHRKNNSRKIYPSSFKLITPEKI